MQAEVTVDDKPIKSVSAVKKYARAKRRAGGANVIWKNIQTNATDLIKLGHISKEVASSITRLVLFNHLSPVEGEAAKRYAYVVARFEKFCTETRRHTKSPSYERAFGSDQELELIERAGDDAMADYEDAAKAARKQYNKLMKVIEPYGKRTKSILDDFCLSDIEPATEFRPNLAVVLRRVAKEFNITLVKKAKRRG